MHGNFGNGYSHGQGRIALQKKKKKEKKEGGGGREKEREDRKRKNKILRYDSHYTFGCREIKSCMIFLSDFRDSLSYLTIQTYQTNYYDTKK